MSSSVSPEHPHVNEIHEAINTNEIESPETFAKVPNENSIEDNSIRSDNSSLLPIKESLDKIDEEPSFSFSSNVPSSIEVPLEIPNQIFPPISESQIQNNNETQMNPSEKEPQVYSSAISLNTIPSHVEEKATHSSDSREAIIAKLSNYRKVLLNQKKDLKFQIEELGIRIRRLEQNSISKPIESSISHNFNSQVSAVDPVVETKAYYWVREEKKMFDTLQDLIPKEERNADFLKTIIPPSSNSIPTERRKSILPPQRNLLFCNFFTFTQKVEYSQFIARTAFLSELQPEFTFRAKEIAASHTIQLSRMLQPSPLPKPVRRLRSQNGNSELASLLSPNISSSDFFGIAMSAPESIPEVQSSFLASANPSGKLYYFGLHLASFTIDELNSDPGQELVIYPVSKFLVLQTFCPLTPFIRRVLEQIANNLGKKLLAAFLPKSDSNAMLPKLTNSTLADFEAKVLIDFLRELFEIEIPHRGASNLIVPRTFSESNVPLLSQNELDIFEASDVAANILSRIPSDDFIFILFALLLEKKVIFVSEKLGRVTQAVSTFLSFIRPFNWPFPVIYSLPFDLISLISCSVPAIFGIQANDQAFVNQLWYKYKNEEDLVWVLLDHDFIIVNGDTASSVIIPSHDDFTMKVKQIYSQTFKNSSMIPSLKLSTKEIESTLVTVCLPQREIKAKAERLSLNDLPPVSTGPTPPDFPPLELYKYIKEFFEDFVVKRLPKEKGKSNSLLKSLNYLGTSRANQVFLRRFAETEILAEAFEKQKGIQKESN